MELTTADPMTDATFLARPGAARDDTTSTSTLVAVAARAVTRVERGTVVLTPTDLRIRRGELVAIAGGSGAGKSSLLEILAGVRAPASGAVLVGRCADADGRFEPMRRGFVPQDDIVHTELPLRRTLRFDAELRLGSATSDERRALVDRALQRLRLADHADVRVGDLSGGQRKRASIAAELLTDPEVLLLDEPTSGLDPVTSAEVLDQLRGLAAGGTTVVMTTHAPSDLDRCDRVVFMAPGGRVAFVGTPTQARRRYGVDDLADVYSLIVDTGGAAPSWSGPDTSTVETENDGRPSRFGSGDVVDVLGVAATTWTRQWSTVTRRSAELIARNRLTAAILLGSPLMVIGMMAALFRPGAFDVDASGPMPAIQLVFWVVFCSFFFGLTAGLLQIVTERSIVRRERFAGLRPTAYVAAKVTVLAPFLAVVDAAMLAVLRVAGQLPAAAADEWVERWLVVALVSFAGLGVGLLASALVRTASQATLALPLLCFPQVLFAGAVVPVSEMAVPGRAFSAILAGRWGFESLGRTLGVDELLGTSPATAGFVPTFIGSPFTGLAVLALISSVTLAATVVSLRRG